MTKMMRHTPTVSAECIFASKYSVHSVLYDMGVKQKNSLDLGHFIFTFWQKSYKIGEMLALYQPIRDTPESRRASGARLEDTHTVHNPFLNYCSHRPMGARIMGHAFMPRRTYSQDVSCMLGPTPQGGAAQ